MPRVNEEYLENKRKEIIDAAYRVCTKKPITSVVMKDIIAETGFSHGLIYKYYRDLDDLLRDLVIRINQQNKIDDKLDAIINKANTNKWKSTIQQICDMLSEQMLETGTDIIKISLYSDMLALSEPERVSRIAKKIDKDAQSPLFYLVKVLEEYLEKIIREKSLKPVKTVDEIIQFIIISYHGIQTGYALSASYDAQHLKDKYQPKQMFSCLAQSIISMLGGK
ncbi:MAG: TetR/AcrR family transcriptional regulator [Treponemataceae bacterium]|nr:TetR/AcrR family transcriptional regulator [Treponemataceae bacterium]